MAYEKMVTFYVLQSSFTNPFCRIEIITKTNNATSAGCGGEQFVVFGKIDRGIVNLGTRRSQSILINFHWPRCGR